METTSTPHMPQVRRRVLAAWAAPLALALCLTACSTQSTKSSTPAQSSKVEQSESASVNQLDAAKLKGPVEAETVPDMATVVKDVKPKWPVTVEDARGKKITVESGDRMLALDLNGTLTDTLIGMGLEDRLVGRSNSDTQKSLKKLPEITRNGHDMNVEAVLNLHPDLVITTSTIGSEEGNAKLEEAGITVVRVDPATSIDGIDPAIKKVGEVMGSSAAANELVEYTDQKMKAARKKVDGLKSGTPKAPRASVLYVRGTGGVFFILGKESGASGMIQALGLEDVAEKNKVKDVQAANAEALVSLDPQVVLAMKQGVKSTGGIDGLLDRPGMTATTAGENKRIITAADSQLLSYGPRTPANLESLATAIYTQGETE